MSPMLLDQLSLSGKAAQVRQEGKWPDRRMAKAGGACSQAPKARQAKGRQAKAEPTLTAGVSSPLLLQVSTAIFGSLSQNQFPRLKEFLEQFQIKPQYGSHPDGLF